MKKTVLYCDVCKREVSKLVEIKIGEIDSWAFDLPVPLSLDMCDSCAKRVKDYVVNQLPLLVQDEQKRSFFARFCGKN